MRKFLTGAALALIFSIPGVPVSAQFLKADGTKIVNDEGEEVIWRGIGLGGWMLQEGYMLRTSGPQHEIEAKIEDLIGQEKKEEFYDAWLANHMRKIDVDSLASWGYNMIRLPMHYKLFTPPIEEEPVAGEITWLDKGFEMTDELLEWCKANNMYLILDLHAAPGGQGKNADISDYDDSKPSLWESEANQAKTIALWRKLAERYADEPMIAAYDLINEPNWGFQNIDSDPNGCAESQNTLLWQLQKDITEAIREVDSNHIIVIEGNCWGNNYSGLPILWDDNLVISYHKYWNGNEQTNIQGMLNMRNERDVPIWLGETGENSNTWFSDAIRLLEGNGIGWAWWPLKKIGINNPLEIVPGPGYQRILDYWNGSGSKPTVDEAYEALMTYAENLKLENNVYHRDVVDAKIRQPHTEETIPFKNHRISQDQQNTVHATDYDLGVVGAAYADNEYTNTTGNAGGQAWNLGYRYRNDGVDIEATGDDSPQSNGYNVGWTNDGEWLLYTVEVDSTGAYDLSIRFAGQSAGEAHLEVDGVDVTGPIALNATGGFQSWQTLTLENVPLYSGTRKIKFYIDKGGFNFGYLGFFLTDELSELSFGALSGETTPEGNILLNLNKKLDLATVVGAAGFSLSIDGVAVVVTEVSAFPENDARLLLETDESLGDGNDIKVNYDGDQIKAADGSSLEAFSDLQVRNTLPVHLVIPGKVEAESFHVNVGLELEVTTDVGEGQNLGYTSTGDYLEYLINVQEEGTYKLEVRVACESNAGKLAFQQLTKDGDLLHEVQVDVPVTGGWQDWQTVSVNMELNAGRGILKVKVLDPEFNFNWYQFSYIGVVSGLPHSGKTMIYPNPTSRYLSLEPIDGEMDGSNFLKVINLGGQEVYFKENLKRVEARRIDLGHLPAGLYMVEWRQGSKADLFKLIIQ